jgi:hypothetical protein
MGTLLLPSLKSGGVHAAMVIYFGDINTLAQELRYWGM